MKEIYVYKIKWFQLIVVIIKTQKIFISFWVHCFVLERLSFFSLKHKVGSNSYKCKRGNNNNNSNERIVESYLLC